MDAPINKTEFILAAIFRHCDKVAAGKRPPKTEKDGNEAARFWLGVKGGVKGYAKPNAKVSQSETKPKTKEHQ